MTARLITTCPGTNPVSIAGTRCRFAVPVAKPFTAGGKMSESFVRTVVANPLPNPPILWDLSANCSDRRILR